jgi:preprotein translocase subunit SecD
MKYHALLLGALTAAAPVAAVPRTSLEFRLVIACTPGDQMFLLEATGEKLCVSPDLIADISNITAAQAGTAYGNRTVRITLDSSGAARMTAATAKGGVRIGVLYRGGLVSAPVVHGPVGRDVEVDFGAWWDKDLDGVATSIRPLTNKQ